MQEKAMLMLGAASAIVGAVLAAIVNIIHPWIPEGADPVAMLSDIAASTIWLGDHVGIAFAGLLYVFGLTGIYRSITREPASAWARLGFVAAILGVAPLFSLLGVEIVLKGLANAWSSAAGPDKGAQLQIASVLLSLTFALFGIFITVFFGAAHLLLGVAMLPGDPYPRWLGWVAIVGGVGSIWVGVTHLYEGPSRLMTSTLFTVFSGLLTLWLLIVGVRLWQMAMGRR